MGLTIALYILTCHLALHLSLLLDSPEFLLLLHSDSHEPLSIHKHSTWEAKLQSPVGPPRHTLGLELRGSSEIHCTSLVLRNISQWFRGEWEWVNRGHHPYSSVWVSSANFRRKEIQIRLRPILKLIMWGQCEIPITHSIYLRIVLKNAWWLHISFLLISVLP